MSNYEKGKAAFWHEEKRTQGISHRLDPVDYWDGKFTGESWEDFLRGWIDAEILCSEANNRDRYV